MPTGVGPTKNTMVGDISKEEKQARQKILWDQRYMYLSKPKKARFENNGNTDGSEMVREQTEFERRQQRQ